MATTKYALLKIDLNTKRTLDKPENIVASFTIATPGERPMILWYKGEGYMYAHTQHKDNDLIVHYYRAVASDDISELTPDAKS